MNEHQSSMPPPSEVEIKKILLSDLKVKFPHHQEDRLLLSINQAFIDFGGMEKIGSLTGWYMFSKKDLLQMSIARLNEQSTLIK